MTHEERFTTSHWKTLLQQVVLEVQHMASICQVALDAPGVAERVLANDASICGATHETAFRTLRGLLYLHYTEVLHISEVLSPEIAQVIADRVREHLRRRSGTQSGA